jgi:hypothetical protein
MVAVVACAIMNADSIVIATALWRDPSLRASVVAAAEKTVKNPPREVAGQGGNANPPAPGGAPQPQENSVNRVKEINQELEQLKIPMGWTAEGLTDFLSFRKGTASLAKIVGLLFTAIAVSLGAPFWFDLLNKLVNFRASGNKPEKAPPEEPSSPKPPAVLVSAASPPTV